MHVACYVKEDDSTPLNLLNPHHTYPPLLSDQYLISGEYSCPSKMQKCSYFLFCPAALHAPKILTGILTNTKHSS